jgi:hypothetical protein
MSPSLNTMPAPSATAQLEFAVEEAACVAYAAAPTLRLRLRIDSLDGRPVHSLLLDVQVRIAARRRRYADSEKERLADLFGRPEQWGASVQSLLWTNTTRFVPAFDETARVDLPIACSYDFEVAANRYLAALEGGEVPLELLFGGSVFRRRDHGGLELSRLPLDREARFGLPVSVWRQTMDHYFPGSAWLRLRRDSFDRLAAYRARLSLPTWESVMERLLDEGGR